MRSWRVRHDGPVSPPRVPPNARTLVEHLAGGRALPAELQELEAWLAGSARFRAFVDVNRDKIRKKLRVATTPDTRLDLRAELRFASLLLADRRFELQFEAYGSGNRGPDFTATFRAGRPFNVEVTRRHAASVGIDRVILGKLRQLPPSIANVLVIALDSTADASPDVDGTMRDLRARADRRDDAWFAARGVSDAATFNQGWLRLAAVLVWADATSHADRWANAGARISAPNGAVDAILAALETPEGQRGPTSS
jgi:hypothetical protein